MAEIRPLTSVRGIAALWVFLHHLAPHLPSSLAPARRFLALDRGYLAVDLFFVLSGFVLALTYGEKLLQQRGFSAYGPFLQHRLARVMPLNLVVVGVVALVVWWSQTSLEPFAEARHPSVLLANLLLIQDWGIAPSIITPAWSLSVEMAIYLVFPLLLRLALSRTWMLPALAGVAALALLTHLGLGQVDQGFFADDFMALTAGDFVRGLVGFYFGLLCFRAFQIHAAIAFAGRLELPIVVTFLGAVAWSPNDLAPVLIGPPLVLVLAADRGWTSRLLRLGPLHYLGTISYSIYLTHFGIIVAVQSLIGPFNALSVGLTMALTIVASILTYHFVEHPARRWLRRFGSAQQIGVA